MSCGFVSHQGERRPEVSNKPQKDRSPSPRAWSADLQPLWQRADQVLLAASGETILAGWEPGPFRPRTLTEQEESELTLLTLDAQGEECGSLRLPWALVAMACGPSCRKEQRYLSAPDGALVALKLPQTGAR